MIESTKIWTTTHRGMEILFWQTGERWFAVAPGQEPEIRGHCTLRAALQCAFDFINDDRMVPVSLPSQAATPQESPQPAQAESAERSPQFQAVGR